MRQMSCMECIMKDSAWEDAGKGNWVVWLQVSWCCLQEPRGWPQPCLSIRCLQCHADVSGALTCLKMTFGHLWLYWRILSQGFRNSAPETLVLAILSMCDLHVALAIRELAYYGQRSLQSYMPLPEVAAGFRLPSLPHFPEGWQCGTQHGRVTSAMGSCTPNPRDSCESAPFLSSSSIIQ